MGQIPRAELDASPRIAGAGQARRDRPVFREHRAGSSERDRWTVEVVPLPDTGDQGAALTGGSSRRVMFEVRAEFMGPTLAEFDFSRRELAHRTEAWNTGEHELAIAVARRAVELLRAGERDLFLPRLAEQLRRAG